MPTVGEILFWLIVPIAGSGALVTALILLAERSERLRKAKRDASLRGFGLVNDPAAVQAGWKYLSRGTWQGVALAIGERQRTRMTSEGPRTSTCLEIMTSARTSLGQYRVPHRFLGGVQAGRASMTGDAAFDHQFAVFDASNQHERAVAGGFDSTVPVTQVPWLDDTVRGLLLSTREMQELSVHDHDISIVLRSYDHATFRAAVNIALHLALWPHGHEQAYR